MSITPVRYSVEVKASPARAFALFTGSISRWWPRGKTIGSRPHAEIVFEPFAGGRWFERDAAGAEAQWGKVLAYEPPARLLLGWQLGPAFTYDPDILTEVELRFEALPGGGTRVSLEHRDLERFGIDAERIATAVNGGWRARLDDFAGFADATEREDA